MSSPKLNLPMLSPYLLGEVMSSHDGVSCYPAIRRGTDEKYIVKVISIPASQSKLDALLLTGALSDKDAALDYFMTLSKDVISQTDILRGLSHQEGFVPYLEAQIQPMEGDVGYHVYLLGTYKETLARIFRNDVMTHADVTNLGLDLCAALAASRRTGYLYVDLKPGNIFRDPEQGFRIGDVGFIALSSLKYASLPAKYRSSYTAPELADDMAVVNATADIYALGLVLYQAYNGGVLPFEGAAPAEILPPPVYADYEMAEIILKACHPDPKQRWQEPTKMAHALIDYLQTYGAPETPIIPPVLDRAEEEEVPQEEPFLPEADPQQLQKEIEELENADPDELAFLSGLVNDETAPSEENTADVSDAVMTEELSEMFAQADELISHELPEPPVAPEPVFAPMPAPIVLEEDQPTAQLTVEEAVEEITDLPEQPLVDVAEEPVEETEDSPTEDAQPILYIPEEAPQKTETPKKAAKKKAPKEKTSERTYSFPWKIAVAAAVMVVLLIGCFFIKNYYENQYLLQVDDLVLTYDKGTLTVQVISEIDDSLLSIVCTDSYGNSSTSNVVNGIATFNQLNPGTYYTVKVEVSGHHELGGKVYENFATPAQTQILSFTAGIGPTDCSVALNFTVSGPETDNWIVVCTAEGLPEKRVSFTGRSVVVTDLAEGAHYTFTLVSPDSLYLAGKIQTEFVATRILFAQDLTINECGGGKLTAQWQQPEGYTVTEWYVRCYNESGYNVTVATSDLSYTFTELDHSTACTVEVTAAGMNQSISTSISANPVTVTGFTCGLTEDLALAVSWEYTAQLPVESWILRYSIDGGEEKVLLLQQSSATIQAVYNGSYNFTIETADRNTVFGGNYDHTVTDVEVFGKYAVTSKDLTIQSFLLPEGNKWTATDIPAENFRTDFTVGEAAGLLITVFLQEPEEIDVQLPVQFVVHDTNGNHLQTIRTILNWKEMWDESTCVLILPYMPEATGEYTISLYFDGCFVHTLQITVQESVTEQSQPE